MVKLTNLFSTGKITFSCHGGVYLCWTQLSKDDLFCLLRYIQIWNESFGSWALKFSPSGGWVWFLLNRSWLQSLYIVRSACFNDSKAACLRPSRDKIMQKGLLVSKFWRKPNLIMIPFPQSHATPSEKKSKKQRQNEVKGLCSVLDSVLHSLEQLVDSL